MDERSGYKNFHLVQIYNARSKHMQTEIKWNEKAITKDLPIDESGFYKEIGKLLPDMNIPNTLYISCNLGSAEFSLKQRGSYIKDGETKPSLYVVENYNNISGLIPSTYPAAYLTCVNPESNNYKYYWLKPDTDAIHATYGRIGSERGEMFGTKDLKNPYEPHMFWIRYFEKLSKGYVDQSDIYLSPKTVDTHKKQKSVSTDFSDASAVLYSKLLKYSKHVVETNLINKVITFEQIQISRKYFNAMGQRKTVKGFNNQLLKLLMVCPRKVRYVDELLASSKQDFSAIMEREENLIQAMEAVVTANLNPYQTNSFSDIDVEVYYATEEQKEQVLRHLDISLKSKVKHIYRVIPEKQQKRFNEYIKKKKINNVRQLWHGSRNENWLSIAKNGLSLNPNAVITGKMFGNGIYFASSSLKSWKYTSYRGSYWANGTEDIAFMGLYAVAYGRPHNATAPYHFSQNELEYLHADCVHAHAGTYLQNDEIIFYDEDAIVMNYIVEFE